MKIGVMQGRLTKPINDKIQEFPENWKIEFELLKKLNLNHIDWIVTKDSFKTNPLFSEPLEGSSIFSICADNLIDRRFIKERFLNKNLTPICEYALKNKIKNITIPLLEESSIIDASKREVFSKLIIGYANKYENLNFSFEAEAKPEEILEIVNLSKNFFITYDTGNIASCKLDPKEYISLLHKHINNVHLKDKIVGGGSMPPGYGDVNFKLIFQLLKSHDYGGVFTIQTQREETGKEQETILNHKNFFEVVYND